MEHALFGDQVVSAAIIAWLIQQVKASRYMPFVTEDTTKLNRLLAALLAALATAGILVSHEWTPGTHTLVITVSGLTVASVGNFLWHWLGQYVFAKVFYHAALKGQTK